MKCYYFFSQIISKTILENNEFQQKLVQNINRHIRQADQNNSDQSTPIISSESTLPNTVGGTINTNDLQQTDGVPPQTSFDLMTDTDFQLNEAIKHILCETEQDPVFDQLVDDVVHSKGYYYTFSLKQ